MGIAIKAIRLYGLVGHGRGCLDLGLRSICNVLVIRETIQGTKALDKGLF